MGRINNLLKTKLADGYLVLDPLNRRYLTNFESSYGYVLVSKEETYFYTDSRYIEAAEKNSFKEILVRGAEPKEFFDNVNEFIKKHSIKTLGFEDNFLNVASFNAYSPKLNAKLVPIGDAIEKIRQIKTPEEVEYIKKAQRIAEQALEASYPLLKEGMTEKEFRAELEYQMYKFGSEGISFETIVAFGANASMPHAVPSDYKLKPGDTVLCDFGAMVNGYHSDMTRTCFFGEPSEEMKDVYNTVLKSQLAALEIAKPNGSTKSVDKAARDVISKTRFPVFQHGLGHGVGLFIHEGPRFSPLTDDKLVPGTVITVEPGIYLPDIGGVRIEDMIYVTKEGIINLTEARKDLRIL